ncbi:hypothetical protein ACWF7H_25540 [Peribacillus butanolivorans]
MNKEIVKVNLIIIPLGKTGSLIFVSFIMNVFFEISDFPVQDVCGI